MGIAVPIEESGRQHHQKPTMKAFVASSVMALAATTGASPAADPALIYSGLGGVVAPVIGTVDTGLKFHPESGAVTPDFTEAQKEAAPELAANQKDIKHLAYTGHVVQPVVPSVVHTGYHLYGKREAEAEADPALVYTTGHTVVPHVVAPAVYTQSGLVAQPRRLLLPPTLQPRSTLPSTQVSTAHISTTASVRLRPSLLLMPKPTHGAMAMVSPMPTEVCTAHISTMASAMLRPSPMHGAMAMVSPMPMEVSTAHISTMASVMLRPSLMLTSMAATDTPMEVSTAHMFTMASVMLRPNPTLGAMASVASTDTHMSTEVSTEDTLTTTASAMLRPSLTHGAMASVASMDTHMSTEVSTEDTLTTTASAMLRPSLTHGAMAS